jgi:hypothetical protein
MDKLRNASYVCKNGVIVSIAKNAKYDDGEWYTVTALDAEGEELYFCNHSWEGALITADGLVEAFNEE